MLLGSITNTCYLEQQRTHTTWINNEHILLGTITNTYYLEQ